PRRLKISARSCTLTRSLALKTLAAEKSTFIKSGPVMVFLPRFPYVPAAGLEKAQGSYHRSGVPNFCPAGTPAQPFVTPDVGLLLKPGFKLGRSGNHRA